MVVLLFHQELFQKQGRTGIVETLVKIQTAEKDKLMLIAALHLDKMQTLLPNVQTVTGGDNETHKSYLQSKIVDADRLINEYIEEVQCHKVDILEEEEGREDT
jgi:hypothetical protein